jgi:hypothetical protein
MRITKKKHVDYMNENMKESKKNNERGEDDAWNRY